MTQMTRIRCLIFAGIQFITSLFFDPCYPRNPCSKKLMMREIHFVIPFYPFH